MVFCTTKGGAAFVNIVAAGGDGACDGGGSYKGDSAIRSFKTVFGWVSMYVDGYRNVAR